MNLRDVYGYNPYTLKADSHHLLAILRVVMTTRNPAVQEAWRQMETLVRLSCPDELIAFMRTKDLDLHEVHIIESERGWGQKVDERLHFLSREHADQFVRDHNIQNARGPDDPVPDTYWRAELVTR